MLPRPGVPTRGHCRPEEPSTGVSRRGHCRPKCPTRLPTGWHRRVFGHFSGAVRADSGVFRRRAKRTRGEKLRDRICVVLPRPDAPARGHHRRSAEAWCSLTEILQAQIPTRLLTLLSNTPQTNMVLFWQPPSYLSPWSPSSFVVDDVSYSCTEQYVIAKKASLFRDHRAVELIISSPDPSAHTRIGRGVCNLESAVTDRENQNAVLSGT